MYAENSEVELETQAPLINGERLSPQVAQTIVNACSGFSLDGMDEALLDEMIDTVSVARLALECEAHL